MWIKNSLIIFLLLCTGLLMAQHSANTSGGDATGSGGTAAYSVGQVVYTTHNGTNGSSAQGVQQPYEFYLLNQSKLFAQMAQLNLYPNPTSDYVKIHIEPFENETWVYQLFDNSGKLLLHKQLQSNQEQLNLKDLSAGIYLLTITNELDLQRSYKIVKK